MTSFQVKEKINKALFIQKTFLLADMSVKVVLNMHFLTLSNADVQFVEKELIYKFYTTAKALPTINEIEFINKKEFVKTKLDENFETFVIHVVFNLSPVSIHPDRESQIAFLLFEEVKIPDEYIDFADVFSKNKNLSVTKEHLAQWACH